MRQVAQQAADTNQLLFLPGVFNETLGLLFDAHQYFQSRGVEEQSVIDDASRAFYANEMTRVTMRLTSVMAWIMVRRAVYAGRIEEEKASEAYRLDGAEICLDHLPEILNALPNYLVYLSERSLQLYERVHRLDAMAYGTKH
jgi:regulator of CtrA degradation